MVKQGFTILLALLPIGCAQNDSVLLPPGDRLAVGQWGGDDAGILVASDVAHVHINCTFGNFPMPITFDANQRFNVAGSYVLRAYPVQVGPELPAVLAGVLEGDRLTFTVAVNDTVEKRVVALGPTTVIYKREPKMQNCPICSKAEVRRLERGGLFERVLRQPGKESKR